METKPIAIVIGRNYTSRLGMIRAAGMAGCNVIVIQTEHNRSLLGTIDDKSKFVIDCKYSPEPNKEKLIETIRSCSQKGMKPVLLPTDDFTAATIDAYFYLLSDDFFLPNINNEQGAILRLMDKSLQKRIAVESGMNVAKEWICNWDNGSYQIPDGIAYPCFTKPQLSSQGHLKKYQKRCNTKEELRKLLFSISNFFHGPILVEEYHQIEKEYAVVGVSIENHCLMPAIIKMDYSWQGVTAIGKLFPISMMSQLEGNLENFIRKTNLIGLFDVDLYECNGKIFFNELNVRFGANGFAVTDGVCNLPGLFIHYLLGHNISDYLMPKHFDELSFANENCLRQLYLDGDITLYKYKYLRKGNKLHAIDFEKDLLPFSKFSKTDYILPLWKLARVLKKHCKKLRHVVIL